MPLPIILYPDPVLMTPSEEVRDIDAGTQAFIDALLETMRTSSGCVGIAAPQVGALKRIIAVDVTPKNPGYGLVVFINPIIVSKSGSKTGREGCLSIPEYTANITRAAEITVKGLDRAGKEVVLEAKGFEAVAFQHEIDHLDGILFMDRIANLKRDLFRRKVKEA